MAYLFVFVRLPSVAEVDIRRNSNDIHTQAIWFHFGIATMKNPVSLKFIVVASLVVLFVAYLAYLFIAPRLEFRQAQNEVTALQKDCQNHAISFSQYIDRIEALAEDHDFSMAYLTAIVMNHSFGEYVRSKRDNREISADEYSRYLKTLQRLSEAGAKRN